MLNQIELKPATPGKHAERIGVGMTHDWRYVTLELQNDEGESVQLLLDQQQAFNLSHQIQGHAILVRA